MPAPQRIVVFLPNWVGDAVMATPALRSLRQTFPEASLVYLGRSAPLQTVADLPHADGALLDAGRSLTGLLQTARCLRAFSPDLAILLPNSFRSALTARLGRARRRLGYGRNGRSWLLTDQLNPPRNPDGAFKPVSARDYYLALVEALGCRSDSVELELTSAPGLAEPLLSQVGYDPARPLVILNPGGANNLSKKWLPERFAAVGDALAERCGAQIVVNAAPAERPDARAVLAALNTPPLLDFAERPNSLPLAKSLIARASLVVTNDTGARHLAAGLDTPVITVFISTDPEWARIDCPHERIVTVNDPFRPVAPGSDAHRAYRDGVTVEAVLAAAADLLAHEVPQP